MEPVGLWLSKGTALRSDKPLRPFTQRIGTSKQHIQHQLLWHSTEPKQVALACNNKQHMWLDGELPEQHVVSRSTVAMWLHSRLSHTRTQ